jgi:hypothetical protein
VKIDKGSRLFTAICAYLAEHSARMMARLTSTRTWLHQSSAGRLQHSNGNCIDHDLVFSSCLVCSVLQGANGVILAYGQTGSGKTYSMLGPGFDGNAQVSVIRECC